MENSHRVYYTMAADIPVLLIEGDMTSDSDRDIMDVYHTIKAELSPKYLVVNFEKTNYINSSGIATLINIIQDLGETDGRISFVGLSTHFLKIMDIVGISDFVKIYPTEDDAIMAIKGLSS